MGHAGLRKGTDLRSDKLCKLVSFGLESLESGAREESKHKTYKKPGNCGKVEQVELIRMKSPLNGTTDFVISYYKIT